MLQNHEPLKKVKHHLKSAVKICQWDHLKGSALKQLTKGPMNHVSSN